MGLIGKIKRLFGGHSHHSNPQVNPAPTFQIQGNSAPPPMAPVASAHTAPAAARPAPPSHPPRLNQVKPLVPFQPQNSGPVQPSAPAPVQNLMGGFVPNMGPMLSRPAPPSTPPPAYRLASASSRVPLPVASGSMGGFVPNMGPTLSRPAPPSAPPPAHRLASASSQVPLPQAPGLQQPFAPPPAPMATRGYLPSSMIPAPRLGGAMEQGGYYYLKHYAPAAIERMNRQSSRSEALVNMGLRNTTANPAIAAKIMRGNMFSGMNDMYKEYIDNLMNGISAGDAASLQQWSEANEHAITPNGKTMPTLPENNQMSRDLISIFFDAAANDPNIQQYMSILMKQYENADMFQNNTRDLFSNIVSDTFLKSGGYMDPKNFVKDGILNQGSILDNDYYMLMKHASTIAQKVANCEAERGEMWDSHYSGGSDEMRYTMDYYAERVRELGKLMGVN